MWKRYWSQFVDESMGLVLLYGFLWHRRHPPLAGTTRAEFPALYGGDCRTFFDPRPQPVPLWDDCSRVARTATSEVCDLRFDSPIRTSFDANNRVWGRHWRSLSGDGRRTVVGVDGIVQVGSRWFGRLAEQLTPHGIDVVMMDSPFNHRRTPNGYMPGQLIVGGDLDHQLAVARQGVLDLWTLIESLQQQGRSVGLVGCSYGGWLVLMAGILASRLEFLVSLAPPVDMYRLLQSRGAVVRAVRRGLGRQPYDLEELRQIARAISPIYWTPQLDPQRIELHAARYDRFVSTQCVLDLADRWGAALVMHEDAHYRITSRREINARVAARIRDWWQ